VVRLELSDDLTIRTLPEPPECVIVDILAHEVNRSIAQQKLHSSDVIVAEVHDVIGAVRRVMHGHHWPHRVLPDVSQDQ